MAPKCEPLCHFGDRLYFTTFQHPAPAPHTLNSVASQAGHVPRVRARPKGGFVASPDADASYYYFTIDDELLYLSFFQDWGPLNLAMVYKACILIHELLEDPTMASHRLVLYSSDDPRRKANAALLMALYVMIVQRRAPWEAFHPIAEVEFMPFRDAGRGPSDFNLNIQDCLWGMWKGMQNGLCDMNEFSVEDYEYYEKVENGDWNWLTPNFIAFASPVDAQWLKNQKDSKENQDISGTASSTSNLALQRKLPTPFVNCLDYFEKRNIKVVVRLNNQLYDKTVFLDRGIEHLELYFDDGTNPTDDIVREFLDVADRIIEAGGVVAVHCKAGLGRTGTLIGAYLIWKYGFTANEAIAFMRIVRPGSVVGPQQQYMYLKQLEWTKWAAVDEMRKAQAAAGLDTADLVVPTTPPPQSAEVTIQTTPKAASKPPVSRDGPMPPVTPGRHIAAATAQAKAIAPPGQPRKTPMAKRVKVDSDEEEAEATDVLPDLAAPLPARPRAKTTTSRTPATRGVTASEARPTRVTRSTAGAAVIRKTGNVAGPSSPVKAAAPGSSTGPNKIPRLAAGPTVKSSAAIANAAGPSRRMPPPSPNPSRLPTRIAAGRRPYPQHSAGSMNDVGDATSLTHLASHSYMASSGRLTRAATRADAWMTNNAASSVVAPGTKTERPGLRSVRRRRSSFSSADIVA